MLPAEQFSQVAPELKQPLFEEGVMAFPNRGIVAVYHILLMKDALAMVTRGGDPTELVKQYGITFLEDSDDCRFHADLKPFEQRGLYLPDPPIEMYFSDDGRGHYFNTDHVNGLHHYLYSYYTQDPTQRNIELSSLMYNLCIMPWDKESFADVELLKKGLTFGQLLWKGSVFGFRHLEPKLDESRMKLANGLLAYYEQQIGPIDVTWDLPTLPSS